MMCSQEDYQAGHMEHLYIVSYDPGLHYNPDAEAVMVDLDEPLNQFHKEAMERTMKKSAEFKKSPIVRSD